MAVVAVGAVVTAAACSSSGSGSGAGASCAGNNIKVGVLTDLTGLAASGVKTSPLGVKAGVEAAKRAGYVIDYVTADTGGDPNNTRAAAQKLVQQEHVCTVIAISAGTFSASQYLNQNNIPVVGAAIDGPEWITDLNMFSVLGAIHTDKVSTTFGKFMKQQGVTNVGTLGYSISPSSSNAAKASAVSAQQVGLEAGYVNANFPFGSTNVQPVALAMRKAGVDGMSPATDPNTGFALVQALHNLNVPIKVSLLATGYGGDLLQAGPGALHEAQDVYFITTMEPVEMKTKATKTFEADLTAAGVKTAPTFGEYMGYTSILLLLDGLDASVADPTQAELIKGLSTITKFTAGGLYGSHTLNINDRENIVGGPDNCQWMTKLVGSKFELVKDADPVCGELTDKTV